MIIEPHDIAALERAIKSLELQRDKLHDALDYDAMFYEGDADSLNKIREYLI